MSPYENITESDYSVILDKQAHQVNSFQYDYTNLNEGTCEEMNCKDDARKCLHCKPARLLCRLHYKVHLKYMGEIAA